MKTKPFQIIFLTLIFALSVFSQTSNPSDALNDFWNLALKNNLQTAKEKYFSPTIRPQSLEMFQKVFEIVGNYQFKITESISKEVTSTTAQFTFKAQAKVIREAYFILAFVKKEDKWVMVYFSWSPDMKHIPQLPTPDYRLPIPFADKFKSLQNYDEKADPIQFKKIYPEIH